MDKKKANPKVKAKSPGKKIAAGKKPSGEKSSKADNTTDNKTKEEEENFYSFLCANLVDWLVNQEQLLAGHRLLDKDAIVKSEGLNRVVVPDLKERYMDSGKISMKTPFEYTSDLSSMPQGAKPVRYDIVVTESIPIKVFRIGDFYDDDFNKYNYAHFYLLKLMLEFVDKRFYDFTYVLNERMQKRNATNNENADPLRRSAANLKSLIALLKKHHGGYIGISLPDLFAVDPNSLIMTHDLEYFKLQETGDKKYKYQYTYMYSKETSQAFCGVLVELLEKKFENIEFELAQTGAPVINRMENLDIAQWLAAMPETNTKERMKIALQILGISNGDSGNEKKVSWTAGELIFIFRALGRCGIFIPELKQNKIAAAMSILTGKSVDRYYNKYFDREQGGFSIQSVCGVDPRAVAGAKHSIRKLAHKVKTEMDILIAEIEKAEL